MTKRAALILAGGKARRFQQKTGEWQDKALTLLLGKPLLIHAVETARKAVDEVIVCVNDENRKERYTQLLKKHHLLDITLAVDEKISNINGPNVAILSGLKSTQADFCLTLPCDMPLMKANVIEYMFSESEQVDVAVPMWPNGRLETLVTVLKRTVATEITETLCMLRRPRSDDIMRGASRVLFVSPVDEIRALDPELKSFVNINHPEDLAKLQTRSVHGSKAKNFEVQLGPLLPLELHQLRTASGLCYEKAFEGASATFSSFAANLEKEKSFFWAGVSRENEGEAFLAWARLQKEHEAATNLDFRGKDAFLAAANSYRQEAELHLNAKCRFLAERAWADRAWCESMVMGKAGYSSRYPPKF